MMKRKAFLSFMIAVALLLSGCSIGGDMATMLTPPAMSVGREALTQSIKAAIGEGYELVYPQAGSYRTGIVSVDLNGDGQTEAVCFYRPNKSGKLSFLAMENRGEVWQLMGKAESEAASVGRVSFGDLDGDGLSEIVVGWQYLTDTDGSYEVYTLKNGKAVSQHTGLYTRFVIMEGQPDGLLVMSRNSSTKSVTASLVGKVGEEIGLVNTVAMYGKATDYLAIESARTADGKPAVYIDEQLENGQVFTEVLVIDAQGQLTNELLAQPDVTTLRYTAVTCRDVDGDSVPEIPTEEPLPAYLRDGVEENLYMIRWNAFDGKTMRQVGQSFVDTTERFLVDLPDEWYGKVTVERSEDVNRSFDFKTTGGEALFTVRIYGLTEYDDELGKAGWLKLYGDSDHVYTVYCHEGNSFGINYQRVYGLFSAIGG